MRAGWKTHRIQTKVTRRFIPKKSHFHIHNQALHFAPLFLLPLKGFWRWGWTFGLLPCQTSWNGICPPSQTGGQAVTKKALPGCRPFWIHSSVTAQLQAIYLTLWPYNIGRHGWWRLLSGGMEFHWQPEESRRVCCLCHFSVKRRNLWSSG